MVKKKNDVNSKNNEEKNINLHSNFNLNDFDDENFKEEALFLYNAINDGKIELSSDEKENLLRELDLILNHFDSTDSDKNSFNSEVSSNNFNENINSNFKDETNISNFDHMDSELNIKSHVNSFNDFNLDDNQPNETNENMIDVSDRDDELSVDGESSDGSVDDALNELIDGDNSSENVGIVDLENSLETSVDDELSVDGESLDVSDVDDELSVDGESLDVSDVDDDLSVDGESLDVSDVDDELSVDDALNELIDEDNSSENVDIVDLGNSLEASVGDVSDRDDDLSVDAESLDVSDVDDDLSVDDALNELVQDYSNEVSIKVENLSMEFKVSMDKIDTLKEFVIRTIKRNKSGTKIVSALKDISFEIPKGDRVGIIGFNGAGKSTLLKVLAGVYDATEGTIKTNGKIAPLLELGAGFDHNYTGKDNIFLNGAFLGYSEEFLNEKYDEIVEFSELGEAINYHVKTYSSGMRAKLGFSIATIVEPDILILDEVLSVGDVKFRKKSADKIRSLINSGITVLLVSHSVGQIRDLCNKAIWLDEGKLKMYGEVNEVCDAYLKAASNATKDQLENIQLN